MIFRHPEFLYLMLPALVILFYFLMTQKEHVSTFFSEEVLAKLRVTSNILTLQARNALFFIMFALLIVALAEPVIEQGTIKVQAKSADIMVALDISDSMLASDAYPNRLAHAKAKILSFLKHSDQQRIGVMAFAKEAYLVAPLSFDHKAIAFLLKQLNPNSITEQGTSFMQLLFSTSQTLSDNENRYLLIVTDGGDQKDFAEEIAKAKAFGIKVFVLAIGTQKGAPIKKQGGDFIRQNGNVIISHLNTKIKDLAIQSGGAYIEAVRSDRDIEVMLQEINAKTSKQNLAEEEVRLYIPLFYYPLGLAMILFVIATSSMSRRKEVSLPMMFALGLFFMSSTESRAGLFDFELLDTAKSAYEKGDYNSSARHYLNYLQEHNSSEARYDYANALYKKGAYKLASDSYEKIVSSDEILSFKSAHNLGNAYAKQGDIPSLKKAISSYEKALAIKDDIQTKENLEAVKKALQEKQKQKKQSKDKDDKKSDDSKKGDKKSDEEKGKSSKDKQNKKDKNEKEGQKKDQKDSQNTKDKQHDQNQKKGDDKPQNDKKANQSDQEKKAKDSKVDQKSAKDENEPKNSGAAMPEETRVMSKNEEKKWLQKLNQDKVGHLYQLQKMDERQREVSDDEKPW